MTEHDRRHCVQLADRLSEFLDGELPEELKREVEAHFDGCINCERFLRSLSRVKTLGSHLSGHEIPREKLRDLGRRALGRDDA